MCFVYDRVGRLLAEVSGADGLEPGDRGEAVRQMEQAVIVEMREKGFATMNLAAAHDGPEEV